SVTEIDDVLVAKMASFFTISSIEAYIFFFSGTFSMIALLLISQLARSCLLVVPLRRARISCFCCGVIPPFSGGFSANLVNDFSIPEKPLSRNFCSTSSTVTSNPAVAATWAMPDPINPQPSTPTFSMSIILSPTDRLSFATSLHHFRIVSPSEPCQRREGARNLLFSLSTTLELQIPCCAQE